MEVVNISIISLGFKHGADELQTHLWAGVCPLCSDSQPSTDLPSPSNHGQQQPPALQGCADTEGYPTPHPIVQDITHSKVFQHNQSIDLTAQDLGPNDWDRQKYLVTVQGKERWVSIFNTCILFNAFFLPH